MGSIDRLQINAQLSGIYERLHGLACVLSLADPGHDWPLEDLASALIGTGALLHEECVKLNEMRPIISEHALATARHS